MKPFTIYGLKCSKKDEKVLVKRVNQYLSANDRELSKEKTKATLKKRLPLVLKHFYWNLNKEAGTYFELFPNEDLGGQFFNEKHKECVWLIKVRIDLSNPSYEKVATEEFLSELLRVTNCEHIVLKEGDAE